jgi:hypothetical protein
VGGEAHSQFHLTSFVSDAVGDVHPPPATGLRIQPRHHRPAEICSLSRRTAALRPVRPITPKMAGIGRGALRRTLHPDEDYAVSQPD